MFLHQTPLASCYLYKLCLNLIMQIPRNSSKWYNHRWQKPSFISGSKVGFLSFWQLIMLYFFLKSPPSMWHVLFKLSSEVCTAKVHCGMHFLSINDSIHHILRP